jgi:hypothetical protein
MTAGPGAYASESQAARASLRVRLLDPTRTIPARQPDTRNAVDTPVTPDQRDRVGEMRIPGRWDADR